MVILVIELTLRKTQAATLLTASSIATHPQPSRRAGSTHHQASSRELEATLTILILQEQAQF